MKYVEDNSPLDHPFTSNTDDNIEKIIWFDVRLLSIRAIPETVIFDEDPDRKRKIHKTVRVACQEGFWPTTAVFDRPPYSPDLVSCEFYPKMNTN